MSAVDIRNLARAFRGRIHAIALVAALIVSAVCAPRIARAGVVRVPLTIDYVTLTEALKQQMYTGPGGRAPLWNGIDNCQFLYADNPVFGHAGTLVSLETVASLGLGVAIAGRCVSPIAWSGIVEAQSSPYIAPGLQIKFRIADINLFNPQHQKTLIAGEGFDLIKRYLIPRLETFSYDLNPALQQLGALAEEASPPEVADRVHNAIATVRADPAIEAIDDGVRITLIITVPDFPTATATASPGEPTPQELDAFKKRMDDWDAFLVFAVKQLGVAVGDKQFRDRLMQILIESRYRLSDALSKPPSASGPDPVRILFLDTWNQLGATVREAARRGQLGAQSLQFLSFISAGDALFALDQAAPALGMRVSAADLRRLVHILAPQMTGDPLYFSHGEDPELKKLFGVPEPLSSPPESESEPPNAVASPTPTASPTPSRAAPMPSPHAAESRWLRFPLWLIEPADVSAAEPATALAPRLQDLGRRLRRVVVDETNADRYRTDMDRLLALSAERELSGDDLDPRYSPTFRILVKSAAWQESCWRQFIRRGNRVTWLESKSGDIGLMQVNKHVWRGFYDLDKLRWDVLYNAGAGAEILMRMMTSVVARGHREPFRDDGTALARSTYAAYNGGPDDYDRWRGAIRESAQERKIDASFLAKLRSVQHGASIDILSCAADWGK